MSNAFTFTGRFFVVLWPLEAAVTVVPEQKMDSSEHTVGEECTVKEGKNVYTGKVAAVGKYTLVHGHSRV